MSQHYFQTESRGRSVTVLMGWDRPTSQFFLVVEGGQQDQSAGADDDDEEYLYSNLWDTDARDQDLGYFLEKLKDLGIEVPASMSDEIRKDQAANVGNRRVIHEKDGTFAVA